MTYADSGFLVSLYLNETTSNQATTIVRGLGEVVTITWLTVLEFENALLRAVFQRRIDLADAMALKATFDINQVGGIFQFEVLDGAAMATEASRLANHFTPAIGTRTLDLLHVAAATMLQCQTFLSFDDRQRRAAAALGLTVLPV